jgi:hypothetical protein
MDWGASADLTFHEGATPLGGQVEASLVGAGLGRGWWGCRGSGVGGGVEQVGGELGGGQGWWGRAERRAGGGGITARGMSATWKEGRLWWGTYLDDRLMMFNEPEVEVMSDNVRLDTGVPSLTSCGPS